MMWILQYTAELAATWLFYQPTLNLLFAALCVWSRFGLCPRRFALLSALLYLALAFC